MAATREDLRELLDTIRDATEGDRQVSFGHVLEAIGRRSFGPILLVAGLIILAPIIGDIPGVPTAVGIFVLLTVGQILVGQSHPWLPKWMLDRTVKRASLIKAIDTLQKPARVVDRVSHPRLTALVHPPISQLLAAVSLIVALGMPAMEVVPFSANAAGLILACLGLAMVASDGLLALIGLLLAGALMAVAVVAIL